MKEKVIVIDEGTGVRSKETLFSQDDVNSYLEMVAGILSLRHPLIQKVIMDDFPLKGWSLTSSFSKQDLLIPKEPMITSMRSEGLTEIVSLQKSCSWVNRIFLVALWDRLNSADIFERIKFKPEIQFFYHIRHACGHDGKLNFKAIKYPAEWREKKITSTMRDVDIWKDLLKPADPLFLVLDIHNAFFSPHIDLTL